SIDGGTGSHAAVIFSALRCRVVGDRRRLPDPGPTLDLRIPVVVLARNRRPPGTPTLWRDALRNDAAGAVDPGIPGHHSRSRRLPGGAASRATHALDGAGRGVSCACGLS